MATGRFRKKKFEFEPPVSRDGPTREPDTEIRMRRKDSSFPFASPGGAAGQPEDWRRREGDTSALFTWHVGDTVLDKYIVLATLGEGGMGKVYRVRHPGWGIDLAMKTPRVQLLENPVACRNFAAEAETWVNLGLHPNIVCCHYVRNFGGLPLIFAECVEGGSLSDWIKSGRLRDPESIVDVAIQFAWGLHYAHEKGLVHQDVKPANVMMTVSGCAKVTDFGLARERFAAGEKGSGAVPGDPLVSVAGYTPAYCSPEQLGGRRLDRRTDIWSWAVSVLQMFTGGVTWYSGIAAPHALEDYLKRGCGGEGLPPMPPGVAEVLRKALRENPEERYRDIMQAADELREIYAGISGTEYQRVFAGSIDAMAADLNNRVLSLIDLGKLEEAGDCFERAVCADPQHVDAVYNRALFLWRRAQYTENDVIQDIRELFVGHRRSAHCYCLAGMAYLEMSDSHNALECLHKAVDLGCDEDLSAEIALAGSGEGYWGRCLGTASVHTSGVSALAFSHDGKFAASGSRNGLILILNMESGGVIAELEGHTDAVRGLAFLSDGERLVSVGWDKTIRFWRPADGVCVKSSGAPLRYDSLCLSPDGKTVLAGLWSESECRSGVSFPVDIWDAEAMQRRGGFEGHTAPVTAICCIDDANVLSADADGMLIRWGLAAAGTCEKFKVADSPVCALTFAGGVAVFSCGDGTVRAVDLTSKRGLGRVATGGSVPAICRNPQTGHAVVAVSPYNPQGRRYEAGHLYEIDLDNGRRIRSFDAAKPHGCRVTALAASAEAGRVLTGDRDGVLKVWSLAGSGYAARYSIARALDTGAALEAMREAERLLGEADADIIAGENREAYERISALCKISGYEHHPKVVSRLARLNSVGRKMWFKQGWCAGSVQVSSVAAHGLCLSEDLLILYVASHDGRVYALDTESMRVDETYEVGAPVYSLATCPGRRLLMGTDEGGFLVDLDTKKVERLADSGGGVRALLRVACSAHGLALLSYEGENRVRLFDVNVKALSGVFGDHGVFTGALGFTADGSLALTGGDDGVLRIWNPITGERVVHFAGGGAVTAVAQDISGRVIVSLDAGGRMIVRDFTSPLMDVLAHDNEGRAVSVFPGGRFIATCGGDSLLKIWNLEQRSEARTFSGHDGGIHDIAIDPRGHKVYTCDESGKVMAWSILWTLDFPGAGEYSDGLEKLLRTFAARNGTSKKTDLNKVFEYLGYCGYGWVDYAAVARLWANIK